MLGYQFDTFLIGVFPQQWWSFAGSGMRDSVRQLNCQCFIQYFPAPGWNIGLAPNILVEAEAPDTIVIITADNGAWQDAWPDAGTHPFRGEKGSPFEAGWRVPGIVWAPGRIPAGAVY